jgi:kinesin family protein C2/C3
MFRKGAVARTVGGIYNKWRVAPSAPSFEEAILPSKAAEENGSHLSQDDADYREDKTSNLIRDLNEYEHCASQLHESYEWLTSQGSGLRKDPTQAEVFYDILFKSFVLDSAISRKMESEESAPKNQEELPSNTLSHASKYVNSKESFNQILSILGSLGSDDILFSLWCDKSAEGRLSREILGEVRGFLDSEGALLHKASDYKALVESSSKVQAYKAIQQELSAQVQQLNHDMVLCLEEKENMRGRWKYELDERRRLNEQLQELKGNIRVYCRIRGKRQAESEPGDLALIKAYDDTSSEEVVTLSFTQLNSPHASEKKKKAEYKSFPFDRVYDASSTQKDVYGDTSELVASVMDGSNVCIFAYGQTGSGKTHTMLGSQDSPGIVLNALRDLFSLKSKREGVKSYTIQLSIKEIYQEQVRDLLSGDDCNNSSSLAIRIDPESNLPITPDQICLQVESMEQCHSSILKAMESRKTSSTLLNERSSRSHLIVSVLVQGKDLESKAHFASKLNLVDLAGSERLDKSKAQGLQKKEAIKINCSLSALSDVLMALKRKKDHVPYRNSKLTHLLQDSLGQGSKTLMLTTLAPTKACIHESLSSVRFAMKVKEVELAPNQSKKGERRPR